jgi:hypothetical protein
MGESFENSLEHDPVATFEAFTGDEAAMFEDAYEQFKGTDYESVVTAFAQLAGITTEQAADVFASQLEQSE